MGYFFPVRARCPDERGENPQGELLAGRGGGGGDGGGGGGGEGGGQGDGRALQVQEQKHVQDQ